MTASNRSSLLFRALALLALLTPIPGWTYVDPNAGGALLQLLAPLFAAAAGGWLFMRRWVSAMVRRWWERLRGRPED